jgi:hypothetical protein
VENVPARRSPVISRRQYQQPFSQVVLVWITTAVLRCRLSVVSLSSRIKPYRNPVLLWIPASPLLSKHSIKRPPYKSINGLPVYRRRPMLWSQSPRSPRERARPSYTLTNYCVTAVCRRELNHGKPTLFAIPASPRFPERHPSSSNKSTKYGLRKCRIGLNHWKSVLLRLPVSLDTD